MSTTTINVPDIGDFDSVEVVEILVNVGDSVDIEESLITLESDKASMEIPTDQAGTVKEILIKIGDRVAEGAPILILESSGKAGQPAKVEVESPPVEKTVEKAIEPETAPTTLAPLAGEKIIAPHPMANQPVPQNKTVHASPSIRRFARELGADLNLVQGSGRKGRITKTDIQTYIKAKISGSTGQTNTSSGSLSLPTSPSVDFSKFGEIEEKALPRIKKISGQHLHHCWLNIPHVTQFDEADITELEAFRKAQKAAAEKQGLRLTFMPFLIKALVKAMTDMPEFNSSLSADKSSLIYKKYLNIGIAVNTKAGLVVPVIKNADQKSVFELAADLLEISQKARDGKLAPKDMQGGCITITSLGGIGGTQFTPIVNAPEVAILGVSRAAMKPVWDGSEFKPRLMMPFSLSYDHRVIDGVQGVQFTSLLNQLLSDIRRILL